MVWVYIILGFLLIFNILLFLPLKIKGKYDDEFTLSVKILWFELFSIPKKELTEKQKAKKEAKKKRKQRKKEKKRLKKLEKMGKDINDIAQEEKGKRGVTLKKIRQIWIIVRDTAANLVKYSRFLYLKRFNLILSITGDDAADAAVNYGEVCAFVYPVLGIICNRLPINKGDFKSDISVDYFGQKDVVYCDFEIHIKLLIVGFIVFVHAVNDFSKLNKKEKRKKYE